mmetsp:Transcript_49835/g.134037  ORF Transcript_49835/g.134037 Transcript_49835/m.134037 type:complete len:249 (-) Transcript_49835:181-927(-)
MPLRLVQVRNRSRRLRLLWSNASEVLLPGWERVMAQRLGSRTDLHVAAELPSNILVSILLFLIVRELVVVLPHGKPFLDLAFEYRGVQHRSKIHQTLADTFSKRVALIRRKYRRYGCHGWTVHSNQEIRILQVSASPDEIIVPTICPELSAFGVASRQQRRGVTAMANPCLTRQGLPILRHVELEPIWSDRLASLTCLTCLNASAKLQLEVLQTQSVQEDLLYIDRAANAGNVGNNASLLFLILLLLA